MLKKFERHLLAEDWNTLRDGLEVKLCAAPDGTSETFILCRSRDRREKEQALHQWFERRIEAGLERIAASCQKKRCRPVTIAERVGRLLGQNSRAARLFEVEVRARARRRRGTRLEENGIVAGLDDLGVGGDHLGQRLVGGRATGLLLARARGCSSQ